MSFRLIIIIIFIIQKGVVKANGAVDRKYPEAVRLVNPKRWILMNQDFFQRQFIHQANTESTESYLMFGLRKLLKSR